MITISSGSFMMIVTAEAAIKAAVKSKGSKTGFAVAFLLGINYPGIVRFVFACKADAKYISEDMQKALGEFMAKHKKSGKQQRTVAGLEYFALTGEQMIILQSLQRQKVLDDISLTKDKRQSEKKLEWYEKWRTLISKASEKPDMPFIEEAELGTAIQIEIEKNESDLNDKVDCREIENSLKERQLKVDKKDRTIKNLLTGANIIGGLAVATWAFVSSMNFEKEGTLTTEGGRSALRHLLKFGR